jgi:hypothetical protein
MTNIGEIGAAGITAIGTLAGIAIAYKATDSMMRNTGMYGKRKSKKKSSSIFG